MTHNMNSNKLYEKRSSNIIILRSAQSKLICEHTTVNNYFTRIVINNIKIKYTFITFILQQHNIYTI